MSYITDFTLGSFVLCFIDVAKFGTERGTPHTPDR